jgi:hypothetical protein
MGRVASAGDNAAMESWHALLQRNVLDRRRWRTRDEVHQAIVSWIEHTYNRRRRQRALGRLTPVEYELAFTPQAADAAWPPLTRCQASLQQSPQDYLPGWPCRSAPAHPSHAEPPVRLLSGNWGRSGGPSGGKLDMNLLHPGQSAASLCLVRPRSQH